MVRASEKGVEFSRTRLARGRVFVAASVVCCFVGMLAASGCGDPHKGLLEATRSATEKSLEAWQKRELRGTGEVPGTGVAFFDDDAQAGAVLTASRIVRVYMDPDQTARSAVELTLQMPGGKSETKNVTYQVVEKDGKVVIARDPFS